MKPVLIIYGTDEGHTRKIAKFIGHVLRKDGFTIVLADSAIAEKIETENYSAIIAGAPIHLSRFPPKFTDLIAKNARAFSTLPTAFFSVCLGVLQTDVPGPDQAERDFVSNLFLTTGWQPQKWAIFPGALLYSKYGWFKRRLMHFISIKAGTKTNMNEDYEYTIWKEVRKFANDFAETIPTSVRL